MKRRTKAPASGTDEIRAIPVRGVPDIAMGDSIAVLILDALASARLDLRDGDILVVKHKIVSKAEGRIVRLDAVKPSRPALSFAARNQRRCAGH